MESIIAQLEVMSDWGSALSASLMAVKVPDNLPLLGNRFQPSMNPTKPRVRVDLDLGGVYLHFMSAVSHSCQVEGGVSVLKAFKPNRR